jgi:hypothetical protein
MRLLHLTFQLGFEILKFCLNGKVGCVAHIATSEYIMWPFQTKTLLATYKVTRLWKWASYNQFNETLNPNCKSILWWKFGKRNNIHHFDGITMWIFANTCMCMWSCIFVKGHTFKHFFQHRVLSFQVCIELNASILVNLHHVFPNPLAFDP